MSYKVQLFWEDHKNMRNCPDDFDVYLVNVKTIRTIVHIFVAFSEKLNFNDFDGMASRFYFIFTSK